MSRVARYGKAIARTGHGDELAQRLLAAADALEADPGCELYLVNRQRDAPDMVWVTELWRSQADLDASIETSRPRAWVRVPRGKVAARAHGLAVGRAERLEPLARLDEAHRALPPKRLL